MKETKDYTRLSKKEIAIYKAVVDMINEGADVNGMKVGEITNRAGIGKGTAYEYFTSKEEMVEEALVYTTFLQINNVKDRVEKAEAFKDKFYCILDYMEENRDQIRTFLWMMRLKGKAIDISNLTVSGGACEETLSKMNYIIEQAEWFVQFAEEEKLITESNKNYQISALISQIVQFGFYLHFGGGQDLKDVKRFIYEGYIKQLNG